MRYGITLFVAAVVAMSLTSCGTSRLGESTIGEVFADREGAFVLIECSSGIVTTFNPQLASKPFPPCSTFKIWNALIGLENHVIASPDESFYHWDGIERSFPSWNKDLTLKEAFQVSCVPAFQNLARQIGQEQMQRWIDQIGYGNRDISAGIDVFWLPSNGRNTILITPTQQAELMRKVVVGDLPFSQTSLSVLREMMFIRKTGRGTLYGKTGSGTDDRGTFVLGWFVGYVVSNGQTHTFAFIAEGENVMGKDVRAMGETILERQGLL